MSGRPLLISDCDEVILHFVQHFAEWVDEAADLHFALDAPGFVGALRHKDGRIVPEERIWPLLATVRSASSSEMPVAPCTFWRRELAFSVGSFHLSTTSLIGGMVPSSRTLLIE